MLKFLVVSEWSISPNILFNRNLSDLNHELIGSIMKVIEPFVKQKEYTIYIDIYIVRKIQENKRGDWQRQWPKWHPTLNKWWNWSSCTKLALSASWIHGLIVQSVRASEQNSVVLGSNPIRPFYSYFKESSILYIYTVTWRTVHERIIADVCCSKKTSSVLLVNEQQALLYIYIYIYIYMLYICNYMYLYI